MILVIVEHFLDRKGKLYFPNWITEIGEVLMAYEGFIAIERLEEIEDQDRCLLLLKFENLDLLRQWSKSEAHDHMISKLEPFRSQKQQSRIFEIK
ncbi:hypothetical protein QQ008_13020 [Fulvivirgaceae bacterium BMA10]|uniref:ABM domain-containing protein n=1 Tax=Splendidivirga corallicola TaxID=3051826 RepID=A0ABT8KNI4_9BACT|nr:hypothetical protein [Fulvivirgaceae bacterium BMA10]